jgi:hypothetical protein
MKEREREQEPADPDLIFEGLPAEWPEPNEEDRKRWALHREHARRFCFFEET